MQPSPDPIGRAVEAPGALHGSALTREEQIRVLAVREAVCLIAPHDAVRTGVRLSMTLDAAAAFAAFITAGGK